MEGIKVLLLYILLNIGDTKIGIDESLNRMLGIKLKPIKIGKSTKQFEPSHRHPTKPKKIDEETW